MKTKEKPQKVVILLIVDYFMAYFSSYGSPLNWRLFNFIFLKCVLVHSIVAMAGVVYEFLSCSKYIFQEISLKIGII